MPLDASTLRRAGKIVEAAGGEVLAVDVHHSDNGSVIIDLTLDMPDDVTETDFAAIAGDSAQVLSHRPAPPEKDPSLRLIRRLAAMLDTDEPGLLDDLTASMLADICGTVSAELLPMPDALELLPRRSQVRRSPVGAEVFHRALGLEIIRGLDDRHPRQAPHQSQVLQPLLRVAIFANGDPGMASHQPDVRLRVRDGDPDLIEATADEACE